MRAVIQLNLLEAKEKNRLGALWKKKKGRSMIRWKNRLGGERSLS